MRLRGFVVPVGVGRSLVAVVLHDVGGSTIPGCSGALVAVLPVVGGSLPFAEVAVQSFFLGNSHGHLLVHVHDRVLVLVLCLCCWKLAVGDRTVVVGVANFGLVVPLEVGADR